jgi:hypothetical protein
MHVSSFLPLTVSGVQPNLTSSEITDQNQTEHERQGRCWKDGQSSDSLSSTHPYGDYSHHHTKEGQLHSSSSSSDKSVSVVNTGQERHHTLHTADTLPKEQPQQFTNSYEAPARMTLIRKRTADLANLDEEDKQDMSERLSASVASPIQGETVPPLRLCLCQRDPKIPRPRNG